MSAIQPTSTFIASVFLPADTLEITCLAVFFLYAIYASLGKQPGSRKSLKSPKLKAPSAEQPGDGVDVDVAVGVGVGAACSRCRACTGNIRQQWAPCGLCTKVELLIKCAKTHQDADTIAIFEEIKATCENTAFQVSLKSSSMFTHKNQQSPAEVFNLLVKCAGRIGRTDLIDVFLEDMASAGIQRPLPFYESTLQMLVSKKCHKEAMSIGSFLEADGLEPSRCVLISLLRSAVALGNKDCAIRFFNRLAAYRSWTPLIWARVWQCAGCIGRTELIDVFLEDMNSAGFKRQYAFYESILKLLLSKKCHEEAMCIGSLLEANGRELSPVMLSCLMKSAAGLGHSDCAISFFNRWAACKGSTPSIHDYTVIIRVHSERKDWPTCVALVRDMQERQIPIDSGVLNVVLSTGVAAGEIEAAKTLLQEFLLIEGVGVLFYNKVMESIYQQKCGGQAIKLLDEMRQVGVKPNATTFNTAMDAALRSLQIADAWRVLDRMVESGIHLKKITCNILMKDFCCGATSEQLLVILDLMRNVSRDRCVSISFTNLIGSVIEAIAQVDEADLTARAIAHMRDQRAMLPSEEYKRLMQVLYDTMERSTKTMQVLLSPEEPSNASDAKQAIAHMADQRAVLPSQRLMQVLTNHRSNCCC